MNRLITIAVIIIVVIIIITQTNMFKINMISFFMMKRGLVAPNEFWWNVSDAVVNDLTGVELYYSIKETYPTFYPTNVYGEKMYVVLNVQYLNIILNDSPDTFSVGILKERFFRPFMGMNVGVLSGQVWKDMRKLNENVLDTGKVHRYYSDYISRIKTVLTSENLPTNFDEFLIIAQRLTNGVVFGEFDDVCFKDVHNVFPESNQSNALDLLVKEKDTIKLQSYKSSRHCIRKYITEDTIRKSVVGLMKGNGLAELKIDQVYHFMFPMVSAIVQFVPRMLILIYSHPLTHKKVNREIFEKKSVGFLRKCIMETFRLNSVVTSLFRRLSRDYMFPRGEKFKKDTEFMLLLNPVLRDPARFRDPNLYIPDRWNDKTLNTSPYNIIFGKGPQRCPGEQLIMLLIHQVLTRYITLTNGKNMSLTPNNVIFMKNRNIRYAINPFKIKFKSK